MNDPIGTPERLVDERGEVACELLRDAWGRTDVAPGARTTTPIRSPAQHEDPETGRCYNRFRYHDPEAGRFVSSDPRPAGCGLAVRASVAGPALPGRLLFLLSFPFMERRLMTPGT
ncbi:RHS repeat domain-containing protein [Sorangium sp. So ce1151]|uniref:RHS repeat domain-containing protein n=1 Tax=Sorangium sp. So ce1151 TaxID=3133332 RepID=UPI003F600908